MHPLITTIAAALAGALSGQLSHHNLAKLSYRLTDEQNQPAPGPRRWVLWTSILCLASLAAAAAARGGDVADAAPLLPLALTGPWLAAVDIDVHRLPNRVVTATGLLTCATVILYQHAVWTAVIAGTALAGIFTIIHIASDAAGFGPDALGFGDVKLAAIIGLAVGTISLEATAAILAASAGAALVWVKATRTTGPIAYGPWLLIGAWIAGAGGLLLR